MNLKKQNMDSSLSTTFLQSKNNKITASKNIKKNEAIPQDADKHHYQLKFMISAAQE